MRLLSVILSIFIALQVGAQKTDSVHIYNPKADAKKDIAEAVKAAKAAHKFVFIQAGGNWCIWCLRFNKLVTEDAQLDSAMKANFIVYHLNYSPENNNRDVFAQLGYPQRFGFPVFIILDEKGNRIHTQNSEYLEEGKGHSKEKVLEFLDNWSPRALDPNTYKLAEKN